MKLPQLDIKGNLNPKWGAGHFHAQNNQNENFEVLVAQPRSESTTSLISWAHSLEKISHPSIPIVHTISHQTTTYVSLKLNQGTSLAKLLHAKDTLLSRFDILNIFYQLATALQKLHSHGVTHGNINPESILITEKGQLKLISWTPPPIQLDFQIRKIDDLKVFQTYFYRCIIGDFPPRYRGRHYDAKNHMTQDEERRQNAWTQWYREEIESPKGGLSSHKLLLFEEHAQDADELLECLHPYLDIYMSDMLTTMNEEILVRLQFRELVFQRRKLQKDLNEIQRHIRNWIATHQEDANLCDEHINDLTELFKESLSYQNILEGICGRRFEKSHTVSQDGLHLGESFAQTSIYVAHKPNHPKEAANQLTSFSHQMLGQQVQHLQDIWKVRELSDPFLDTMNLASVVELQQSVTPYNTPVNYSIPSHVNGGFSNHAYDNTAPEIVRQQGQLAHQSNLDQTQHEDSSSQAAYKLNHLKKLSQKKMPSSDHFEAYQEPSSLTDLHENLTDFIPAQTHTAFTQLYEAHAPVVSEPEPVEFNYKNFLIFLYALSGLIFLWYVLTPYDLKSEYSDQRKADQSLVTQQQPLSSSPALSKASITPDQSGTMSRATPSTTVNEPPLKTVIEDPIELPMIPIGVTTPPKGMLYIIGGEVSDQLDADAHNRAITHCMFAPSFKNKPHSKNYCNRVIKKKERGNRILKVDPFFIDTYEVSRAQYQDYCKKTKQCRKFTLDFTKNKLPMTSIKMIEASDFCTFYGKRLPTYEEWLFAARGSSQYLYPWGNSSILDEMRYRANYLSPKRKTGKELDGHNGPHAVDYNMSRGASVFKVAHMSGNVKEWVLRLKRNQAWVTGGGWRSRLWELRLTAGEYRHQYTYTADDVGFRCAQNIVK